MTVATISVSVVLVEINFRMPVLLLIIIITFDWTLLGGFLSSKVDWVCRVVLQQRCRRNFVGGVDKFFVIGGWWC